MYRLINQTIPNDARPCLRSVHYRVRFRRVPVNIEGKLFQYHYDPNEVTITHMRFTRFWATPIYPEDYPYTTDFLPSPPSNPERWIKKIVFFFNHKPTKRLCMVFLNRRWPPWSYKMWIKCVFTSLPGSVVLSADVISTSQPFRQPVNTCPSLFPSFFHTNRAFSYYACALRLPRPTWVSQHDMILI